MPALAAVLAGISLGFACGGTLNGLRDLELRWEWLILPLFVVQALSRGRVLGIVGASRWSLAVWIVASCAMVIALLSNWRIPGMALGAAGILMNTDVVLLNHAMPVVIGRGAGLSTNAAAEVVLGTGGFYRLSSPADLLVWLGDAMPISLGRSALLVSPGDIVLMVAVTVVLVQGMCLVRRSGTVH